MFGSVYGWLIEAHLHVFGVLRNIMGKLRIKLKKSMGCEQVKETVEATIITFIQT